MRRRAGWPYWTVRDDAATRRAEEKYRAYGAVGRAVRDGLLPRPANRPCIACGAPARHYHHRRGYGAAEQLDVVPVCPGCHRELHVRARRTGPDGRRGSPGVTLG
jgi:hypothetical protein